MINLPQLSEISFNSPFHFRFFPFSAWRVSVVPPRSRTSQTLCCLLVCVSKKGNLLDINFGIPKKKFLKIPNFMLIFPVFAPTALTISRNIVTQSEGIKVSFYWNSCCLSSLSEKSKWISKFLHQHHVVCPCIFFPGSCSHRASYPRGTYHDRYPIPTTEEKKVGYRP